MSINQSEKAAKNRARDSFRQSVAVLRFDEARNVSRADGGVGLLRADERRNWTVLYDLRYKGLNGCDEPQELLSYGHSKKRNAGSLGREGKPLVLGSLGCQD